MLALSLPEGFSGIELSVFFEVSATTARGDSTDGASDISSGSNIHDDSLSVSAWDEIIEEASVVLVMLR